MNERIKQLAEQAYQLCGKHSNDYNGPAFTEKFAELMTNEFIGILQSEIAMVEHYRSTSITDRDAEWHEGKIDHFRKLIKKTNEHFGVK
jgi:hypothetical protein